MIRKTIFMGILLLILFSTAYSAGDGWNVYFSQSTVNDIWLTGDTLVCSTDGGVMLFSFTDSVFQPYYGGFDLRSSFVSGAAFDMDNNLWAGFRSHGIASIQDPFTNPDVTWYTEDYGLISDSVTCVAAVGDEIYFGCVNGIGKFFQGLPSSEAILSDFLQGSRVSDIFATSDSVFWVASSKGVTKFNRSTLFYDHYDTGNSVSITSHGGVIHIATDNTVQKFESGSWSLVGGTGWPHQTPLAGISSGGGNLYCSSWERVYFWNGSWWQSVDAGGMKDLFQAEYGSWGGVSIKALRVDKSGNPWIGGLVRDRYRGVNLCYHDGTAWRNKRPNQLTQNDIRKVVIDPDGGIWASTRLYGVCYFSGSDWIYYTDIREEGYDNALSLNYDNIAILFDSNGRLWCSALEYPVDMIDVGDRLLKGDDQWQHFSAEEQGISSRHVNIVEDPVGNVWFLSDGVNVAGGEWGIDIIDASGSEWLRFNPGNSDMPSGNLAGCAFYGTSAYLALDGYGIEVWNPGGFGWADLGDQQDDDWNTLVGSGDLPSTDFYALEIDEGDLWIATSAGLFKRNQNGDITAYSTSASEVERRILNNTVHDIELDRHGKLWVASEGGLNVIDSEGVVVGKYTTYDYWKQFLQFIYTDAGSVISYLPSAFCSTLTYDSENDILWIGTDNGLASLDVNITEGPELPLSDLILYPNPVYPSRYSTDLMISGISGTVDVRVYNMEGELVHQKFGVSEGEEVWDLLTINGYKAVSGVYLVRIESESGYELRKVAVIR